MMIDRQARKLLFETVAQRVIASADELTDLDRAIGDGDHGVNMRRGFEAVLAAVDELSAKNLGESLKGVGTTLVMKVGGASGPLYGTLFMSLGKSLEDEVTCERAADAFAAAIEAVKARGKSDVGQKTMLDVLFPVLAVLREGGAGLPARLKATAKRSGGGNDSDAGDPWSRVVSGRAQHRSHGSRRAIVRVDRRRGRRRHGRIRMSENVGIVIVSHSADVARGTALMVEQMVGREVPLGWCGGDPGGGLGTSVEAIMRAIEQAWSERGVAILVDLGGAETNSEMAIEMLPEERRDRVVVCNAPVVEGAVMAATEAASGATLEAVRRTAEELTPV